MPAPGKGTPVFHFVRLDNVLSGRSRCTLVLYAASAVPAGTSKLDTRRCHAQRPRPSVLSQLFLTFQHEIQSGLLSVKPAFPGLPAGPLDVILVSRRNLRVGLGKTSGQGPVADPHAGPVGTGHRSVAGREAHAVIAPATFRYADFRRMRNRQPAPLSRRSLA
jgi:hypothetical protein